VLRTPTKRWSQSAEKGAPPLAQLAVVPIKTLKGMVMRYQVLIHCLLISSIMLFSCNSTLKWEEFQGGSQFVIGVESSGDAKSDSKNIIKIENILNNRIEDLSIKKRIIKILGNDKIVIQIPSVRNPELLAKILSSSAILELRLVDDKLNANDFKPDKSPNREILYPIKSNTPYVTETDSIFHMGEYLTYAKVVNSNGGYYISIELNDQGSKHFEDYTAKHIGRHLAIILNDKIYSAPIIREKIPGGRMIIEGNLSKEEASDLAIILMAGAYPARTKLIEVKDLTKDIWLGKSN
jgi:protein-export membrane protein SecD